MHRVPESPKYTGDFFDGFGNRMTVWAVANPIFTGRKPSKIYDRSSGYGIVRFRRDSREIKIECWPRGIDPTGPASGQYDGWPITIHQTDNYDREAYGWLPKVTVSNITEPVIKVYDSDGGLVYALRIQGTSFSPRVFEDDTYTLLVGDNGNFKKYDGLKPDKKKDAKTLEVTF